MQIGVSGHTGCDEEKGVSSSSAFESLGAGARGMMQWRMETPQNLVCTPVMVRYWCILHVRYSSANAAFGWRHPRTVLPCYTDHQHRRRSATCSVSQLWAELVAGREKVLDNSAWGSQAALKSFPGR